jgi:thioredoxin reductase
MDRYGDGEPGDRYDVVVIGGGAAGLSGALALARARRRVLVIDSGEPRNAPAGNVHNYLAREGIPPADLRAAGRAEVTGYGGQVIAATVTAARRLDGPLDDASGGFAVDLADGRTVLARRLLVTTGLVDELPAIPGVAQRWGRDVVHCPYCHGWEVRDQAIGVLATGPLAVHQALMWRQWSGDVVLLLHTAGPLTTEQEEQLAARGVPVVDGEVAGLEVHDDRLTGVHLVDGRSIARQALVVASHLAARAGVLADLGLHAVDDSMGEHVIGTHIAADATGATEVPGVWVAGNVADVRAQVITSAAAGLTAGAAINGDLIAEETRQAVAAHRVGLLATRR